MRRNQMKPCFPIVLLALLAVLAAAPSAGGQAFRDHDPRLWPEMNPDLLTPADAWSPSTISFSSDIEYLIQKLDQNLVMKYLDDLVAFGPRVTGTTACHDAGDYIYQQFEDMGLDVSFHNWSLWGYLKT